MGRAPCCDKANVKKGPWSPEEDAKLKEYIDKNGTGGNWIALPQKAGLKRCGKSCRLRWLNYLRPNIKHGDFTAEEDRIIFNLYANIGSRWSIIAAQLPGRTDNDIKNYWNTKLKKKLMAMFPPPSQRIMITSPNVPTFSSLLPHNPSSSSTSSSSPLSSSSSSSSSLQYHNISTYSPVLPPHQETNTSFMCSMQHYQQSPPYPGENFKDQFEKMGINNYVSDHIGVAGDISFSKFLEFDHVGNLNNNGSSSVEDASSLLDYGLEEIKQLISTSTSNFLFDEMKREENVMYF